MRLRISLEMAGISPLYDFWSSLSFLLSFEGFMSSPAALLLQIAGMKLSFESSAHGKNGTYNEVLAVLRYALQTPHFSSRLGQIIFILFMKMSGSIH